MQGQVVRAGEAAAAGDALEGFGAGVLPVVSGELVGAGETPVAVLPRTMVRFLSWETEEKSIKSSANGRTWSLDQAFNRCLLPVS